MARAAIISEISKSVLGERGTGSKKSVGVTTESSSQTAQTAAALESLVQSVLSSQTDQTQTGTQTEQQVGRVTQFSGAQQAEIESLLSEARGLFEGVDPTAAREAAVSQVLESGIANVIESGVNQGAFDSTVQATAAEKLGSRAATEGAGQETQARLTQQATVASLFESLGQVLKGSVTETTQTGTTESEQAARTDSIQRQTQATDTTQSQTQQVQADSKTVKRGRKSGKSGHGILGKI